MAALSDYLEDAWLNTLKGVAFTPLTAMHIGLHSAEGADETSAAWLATELTGGGYARVTVNDTGWNGPEALGDALTLVNNTDVLFPIATQAWADVTHWSVWDGATLGAGNLLFKQEMSVVRSVAASDVLRFGAGNLRVGLR